MQPVDPKPVYYHFDNSSCYTYFRISGNFDPDVVTKMLELEPDKFWKIGDKRRNGTTYDFASWEYGNCDEYDGYVEKQMLKTIKPLLPKINKLNEIRKMYDVYFCLEIVPYVRFDESAPSLAPSKEIIKFCYETNTDIDIDLYVCCPDSFDGGGVWEL